MTSPLTLVRLLKREYPKMGFLCEAVECPFCHAEPGQPCRTKRGTSTDSPHISRFDYFAEVIRDS